MKQTKHALMTEQVKRMHREYDVAPDLEEVAALLLKHGVSESELTSALGCLAHKMSLGITGEVLEEHGVDYGSSAATAIFQGIHAAECDEAAWRALELGKKKLGKWLAEVHVSPVKH